MDDNFVRAYFTPDAHVDVAFLETLVEPSGYGLLRRGESGVTCLNEEGEVFLRDLKELEDMLAQRQQTGVMQVWQQRHAGKQPLDTYVEVRFNESATVIELNKLPRPPYQLLARVWEVFEERIREGGALALVSDPHAASADYVNWDDVILRAQPYDGPCPELLCLRAKEIQLVGPCAQGRVSHIEEFAVVWRSN